MKGFKKTQERSIRIFSWLKETINEQNELKKARGAILNMGLDENTETAMLDINSEMYRESKKFEAFCKENIVTWHLSLEDQNFYSTLFNKTDNTATMAVHGW